ncbi:MAG: methyltransferase domain-containing protein [Proteobacteria bacterium]|nr:methyltransferase domain-containing protein [Pseudomonadota bacterium]
MTPHAASVEPHPYRTFEHAGWQDAATRYSGSFAHATAGYVAPLLDAVGCSAGARLLDVACGPGPVSAAAAQPGCIVIGVDFSPAMLAEARRRVPTATFQEGDAEALPLPDEAVDAVVSNFGLHHFPFPLRALAEMRRVLRPGGRLAATVWAAPDANPAWRFVHEAIAAHGCLAVDPPIAPHGRLNRVEDCAALLRAAGWTPDHDSVRQVSGVWRLAAADDLIAGFLAGTVRTAALIRSQPPAAEAAIRTAVAAAVRACPRDDGGYLVPTTAILISARKP